MSWNMIIFVFGFILGGCTVMLILGLLALSNEKTEAREFQAPVREPAPEVANPKIYPRLSCLSGAKDGSPGIRDKHKAVS